MKYLENENYLYLLGFLWADGYMGEYETKLDINRIDGEEVIKWLPEIKHSIYYMHRKPYKKSLILSLKDKEFNLFIREHDYCVGRNNPNKILSKISSNNLRHWLRGYLDGDGCIYINPKNRCFQLTFVSAINQDWGFVERFCESHQIKYSVRKATYTTKKNKIHRASYFRVIGIVNMKKFLDVIYKDTEICLTRKYKKYIEIIEYIRDKSPPKICKILETQRVALLN